MTVNPFDPPDQPGQVLKRPAKVFGWWITVPYILPLFILATFMNADGWYGTGTSGWLQGVFRLVVFCLGVVSAYYVFICGSTFQRIAVAPAVFGYTGLILGIL